MESNFSKIILILIAILIVVGVVIGVWYVVQPTVQKQNTISNGTSNSSSTNSNQNQSSGSAQTQGKSQAAVDFNSAYTTLFGKLSAKQIAFTPVTATTEGAVANIYALYSKDSKTFKQFYPTGLFTIDVAAVDLNNDSTAEALVYEDAQGFCGSGGCTLDIYQAKNGKWTKIGSALTGSEIGIASSTTKGYNDLYLSIHQNSINAVKRYIWNGSSYQPEKVVATWDGIMFNLVQ